MDRSYIGVCLQPRECAICKRYKDTLQRGKILVVCGLYDDDFHKTKNLRQKANNDRFIKNCMKKYQDNLCVELA